MNSEPDFDYLPFADGPYRMTMGLMALKPADWIEIDSRYAAEIALRKSLLEERRCEVLGALPGSEAACREGLDQLAGFLPERFPDVSSVPGLNWSTGSVVTAGPWKGMSSIHWALPGVWFRRICASFSRSMANFG